MQKLSNNRSINKLVWVSVLMYFGSYVSRINFAAVMVEFIRCEGLLKTQVSVITTLAFITYGIGQLISGWLGDKINPQRLIVLGFVLTIVMNMVMPVASPNITLMAIIWGVNGLAQSFMWPPLVKILMTALTDTDYSRSISKIGVGSAGGTLAVYLVTPLCIQLFGWKSVFYVSAATALVACTVFTLVTSHLLKGIDYKKVPESKKSEEKTKSSQAELDIAKAFTAIFPVILVTIAMQGLLRDGITTWTPTFLSETFGISSSIAILTSVVLPLVYLLSNLVIYSVLKLFNNDLFACLAAYFGLVGLAAALLLLVGRNSLVVAVILLSLISAALHGVNIMQTCHIPSFFRSTGKVSLIAGVLNAATYVGSAVSTYVFALLAEKFSWNATILFWVIIAALAVAIILLCMLKLHKLPNKGRIK